MPFPIQTLLSALAFHQINRYARLAGSMRKHYTAGQELKESPLFHLTPKAHYAVT
jgi:hypothetical protein